jgi:hypothetical protein
MWHKLQAQPSQSGAGRQVLAPFQFLLCQHAKGGRCTGYPIPKVGGGQVGWPTGQPGFGELLPQINDGAHSLHL